MMKRLLYILVCLLALTACNKGRTYFPKDIAPRQIELVRFDNDLMNVHEASVTEDI